jgi:hypothetical protein
MTTAAAPVSGRLDARAPKRRTQGLDCVGF